MNNNREKIVLVSDYGRSGQGWLSYMLCYLLNAKYIEPYDLLKGRLYTSAQHILNLTGGSLPGRDKTSYSLVVKTHNYPADDLNLTDKIIILKRDPRDVAVSAFNMKTNLRKKDANLSWKSKIELAIHRFPFISHFVTLYKWLKFYQAWSHVNCYQVTYEQLLENANEELEKILDFLELETDEKLLVEAVNNFSFKTITGRERGKEVAGNSEFRKGIAGDYVNYFSSFELKVLKIVFGKQLERHGYYFNLTKSNESKTNDREYCS